jgi:hypothetical protein
MEEETVYNIKMFIPYVNWCFLYIFGVADQTLASMEQSTSWEASILLTGQEIPRILWNTEYCNCVHNSPPFCLCPEPHQSTPHASTHCSNTFIYKQSEPAVKWLVYQKKQASYISVEHKYVYIKI